MCRAGCKLSRVEDQTEALHRQLDRVVQERTNVNSLCWTVFSVFAAAHAVLVNALVQIRAHDHIDPRAGAILCLVGALAAIAWTSILGRVLRHLALEEELVARLERATGLESQLCMTSVQNPDLHRIMLGNWPRVRPVMLCFTALTAIAWFVAFIFFVVHL